MSRIWTSVSRGRVSTEAHVSICREGTPATAPKASPVTRVIASVSKNESFFRSEQITVILGFVGSLKWWFVVCFRDIE